MNARSVRVLSQICLTSRVNFNQTHVNMEKEEDEQTVASLLQWWIIGAWFEALGPYEPCSSTICALCAVVLCWEITAPGLL